MSYVVTHNRTRAFSMSEVGLSGIGGTDTVFDFHGIYMGAKMMHSFSELTD